MRALRPLTERAGDVFIVAVTAFAVADVWRSAGQGSRVGLTVAVIAASLPLLLRSRFPLAAPLAMMITLTISSFPYGHELRDISTPIPLVIMAGWTLGRRNDRSRAVLGVAVGLACIQIINANFSDRVWSDVLFVSLLVLIPWTVGHVVRWRESQAEELHARAEQLELEREQRARAAVAEERLRIARELHDVVAHSISVMTIQAGAARLLLDDDPERAEEPLLRVEETGRQTLGEMRRVLGVLPGEGNGGLEARPSFTHLDSLLDQFRAAGLAVELAVEGDPRPLPAGLDLAAFRVVQEALTNTLKHANAETARVDLRYGADRIELEIADDGTGDGAPRSPGGHGLVGMRERVAIYGGSLDVGPAPGGGFVVKARLPLARAGA